jgi:hypothetical protein
MRSKIRLIAVIADMFIVGAPRHHRRTAAPADDTCSLLKRRFTPETANKQRSASGPRIEKRGSSGTTLIRHAKNEAVWPKTPPLKLVGQI